MRRLRLLPVLPAFWLLAGPVAAQPGGRQADAAFCNGLRQVAGAAASGFDDLPRDRRLIPGSVAERRGIIRSGDGPPRAAFFAVMMRDDSRQRPNPVVPRFDALRQQITRCLPEAQADAARPGQGGAVASWILPMAVVGLRRDDGEAAASTAEVELSVASRW